MTRRQFLPILMLGVGIPSLLFAAWQATRQSTPVPGRLRPRHRPRRPKLLASLSVGLYLNQRSNVIHYVAENGRITGVHGIPNRLQLVSSPIVNPSDKLPHVNLSRAVGVFTNLARQRLLAKDVDGAFGFLDQAIQHDLFRLSRWTRNPPGETLDPTQVMYRLQRKLMEHPPGFVAYDLLAREAVRLGRRERLRQMIGQLDKQNPSVQRLFSDRLKKWTSPSSSWYKKHAPTSRTQANERQTYEVDLPT